MKRVPLAVARRYARALLDVALAQENAGQVRRELTAVLSLLRSHPEIERALTHPAVASSKKKEIVNALWAATVQPPVARLVTLLLERDRLAVLPAIEQAFTSLWNEHRNVVEARATSAVALDVSEKAALEAAITAATGKGVELTTRVEPALLGGVVVKMAGRTYDGTIRARLQALKGRLAGPSTRV